MTGDNQAVQVIRRWFNAHVESSLLQAAVNLRLLDPLQGQPLTAPALAEREGYDGHGVQVLLQGLAGLGVLAKNDDDQYQVVAEYQAALAPGHAAYVGAAVAEAHQFWGVGHNLEGQALGELLAMADTAVTEAHPEAAWLVERAWAYVKTAVLMFLLERDVLGLLQVGACTPAEIAAQKNLAPDLLPLLLQAAHACGVLTVGDEVALSEAAQVAMGAGVVEAYVHWFGQRLQMERHFFWQPLGQLADCVREGKGACTHSKPGENGPFRQTFMGVNRPLVPLLQNVARKIAQMLKAHQRPWQVLEVGAGLGNWGLAWAEAHGQTAVTAVDVAEALAGTQQIVAAAGQAAVYTWQPGNILTYAYPSSQYDLIILNEVCHTIPPRQLSAWFERVAQSLKPGGFLLIADMLLDEARTAPLRHLLAGAKLFVSGGGALMNEADYRQQWQQAGIPQLRIQRLPTTDLILGRKPRRDGE